MVDGVFEFFFQKHLLFSHRKFKPSHNEKPSVKHSPAIWHAAENAVNTIHHLSSHFNSHKYEERIVLGGWERIKRGSGVILPAEICLQCSRLCVEDAFTNVAACYSEIVILVLLFWYCYSGIVILVFGRPLP